MGLLQQPSILLSVWLFFWLIPALFLFFFSYAVVALFSMTLIVGSSPMHLCFYCFWGFLHVTWPILLGFSLCHVANPCWWFWGVLGGGHASVAAHLLSLLADRLSRFVGLFSCNPTHVLCNQLNNHKIITKWIYVRFYIGHICLTSIKKFNKKSSTRTF